MLGLATPGRSRERDERDVVLLLPGRAGERVQRLEQPIDALVSGAKLADELAHPREAEHDALRIVGLGKPVAVQDDHVARPEHGLPLLVLHAWHRAEWHAGRAKLHDLVA